ncbi:MAG: hypothetical protein ACXVJL_13525, partial [Candidatus Angelobacter sp.]
TSNDMKNVWRNQPVASVPISLAELQQKAEKLEQQIRRRNLREYAGSLIAMAIFGYYIWRFPGPMVRFGCVLVIAGVLVVLYQLHKRGAARIVPAGMAFRTCLDFHRRELERQRDLSRSVWTWYLLPFVPGMAIFLLGLFLWTMKLPNAPAHARLITVSFSLTAAFVALVFIAIGKLNQWTARKLQREIDALDSLGKES